MTKLLFRLIQNRNDRIDGADSTFFADEIVEA